MPFFVGSKHSLSAKKTKKKKNKKKLKSFKKNHSLYNLVCKSVSVLIENSFNKITKKQFGIQIISNCGLKSWMGLVNSHEWYKRLYMQDKLNEKYELLKEYCKSF